jgi:hypothetical protein
MKTKFAVAALLMGLWGTASPPALDAAVVVVVANRSREPVTFTLKPTGGKARDYTVRSNDVTAVPVAGPVALTFTAKAKRTLALKPDRAYCFIDLPDGRNLQEVRSTGPEDRPPADPGGQTPPAPPTPPEDPGPFELTSPAPLKIPVKILVDQEELTVRRVWEARLRKRVREASEIFQQHCHVKLEVVAVGTWESDNKATTLSGMLRDFRQKVSPWPGRVAIGFTGRRFAGKEDIHLGITTVPLQRHILLREQAIRSEPERLEVLVHEIGHFLGATHQSPETGSVMRPKLQDGHAIRANFRIAFDPLNTLIMNLVAEDLRTRAVKGLWELPQSTRERLGQVYASLEQEYPDDPLTGQYIRLLDAAPDAEEEAPAPEDKSPAERAADVRVENARRVVAAVVDAAKRNRELSARAGGVSPRSGPRRRTGDELTAYYFREAAAAAGRLPADQAVSAYLIGLGVALDTSDLLRKNPVTGDLWRKIESDDDRAARLEVLGQPTVHGRHDLAQHFVVSGALTALHGPKAAEAAGVLKELLDSQPGGSGFSFADLAADLSGIAFARHLAGSPRALARVTDSFTVSAHALPPGGLPEGLTNAEFVRRYGSPTDPRFLGRRDDLWKRVLALPGYRARAKE